MQAVLVVILLALVGSATVGQAFLLPHPEAGWNLPGPLPAGRLPTASVKVSVAGVGTFLVDPQGIETLRPDVFRPGHLSIFDLLVRLGGEGRIDISWRYDAELATHVVAIGGVEGWWYEAHYAGGGFEPNVVRMDLYPVKDGLEVRLYREDPARLGEIYAAFRAEVDRLRKNGGRVVVPTVTVRGPGWTLRFSDVPVRPHGVRSDVFQPGVMTALDVLLSLGEAGFLFSIGLTWYGRIGRAEPVDGYYVELIAGGGHTAQAYGRCGFIYEAGELPHRGRRGNLVHITSDLRALVSPGYMEWSWTCL